MKSILGGGTCSDTHKDQGVKNAFWENAWKASGIKYSGRGIVLKLGLGLVKETNIDCR